MPLSLNGAENQQHPPTETTAGARVPSTCPVSASSARERTDDNSTIPHQHRHTARHWAAATNKHPPLPHADIDIAAVRYALLDTTRRAQTPLCFGNTQAGILDPEKENRYPRSMSAASSSQDARKSLGRNTPGRRGRTGNQYFDVGKVGR